MNQCWPVSLASPVPWFLICFGKANGNCWSFLQKEENGGEVDENWGISEYVIYFSSSQCKEQKHFEPFSIQMLLTVSSFCFYEIVQLLNKWKIKDKNIKFHYFPLPNILNTKSKYSHQSGGPVGVSFWHAFSSSSFIDIQCVHFDFDFDFQTNFHFRILLIHMYFKSYSQLTCCSNFWCRLFVAAISVLYRFLAHNSINNARYFKFKLYFSFSRVRISFFYLASLDLISPFSVPTIIQLLSISCNLPLIIRIQIKCLFFSFIRAQCHLYIGQHCSGNEIDCIKLNEWIFLLSYWIICYAKILMMSWLFSGFLSKINMKFPMAIFLQS